MSFRWLTSDPDSRTLGVWLDRDLQTGEIMEGGGFTVDRVSHLEIDDWLPDMFIEPDHEDYEHYLALKKSEDTSHTDCQCGNCERYW